MITRYIITGVVFFIVFTLSYWLQKHMRKPDGRIDVFDDGESIRWQLYLNEDLEEIGNKKSALFTIRKINNLPNSTERSDVL